MSDTETSKKNTASVPIELSINMVDKISSNNIRKGKLFYIVMLTNASHVFFLVRNFTLNFFRTIWQQHKRR